MEKERHQFTTLNLKMVVTIQIIKKNTHKKYEPTKVSTEKSVMAILTPMVTFITSWLLFLFLLAFYLITHPSHFFLTIQPLNGWVVPVKGQQFEKPTPARVRFYSLYQLQSQTSISKRCYPHSPNPFNTKFY